MLSNLAQRCHSATLINEIDALFTEINNFYSNDQITYILGFKLTQELEKRAKVTLNINYPLSFPSSSPPPNTIYLHLEDSISHFQLEGGSSLLKLEA